MPFKNDFSSSGLTRGRLIPHDTQYMHTTIRYKAIVFSTLRSNKRPQMTTKVARLIPIIRSSLEGWYPPCLRALYISIQAKTPIATAIATPVIGKNNAGTKSDSTITVKIMPVITLCLNLSLTVFL